MAVSDVQICNIALSRAACQQFINSLDDPTAEARVCKMVYLFTLERVLQDFPWAFARTYAELQDIGIPVKPWAYRYRYPGDCLQAHRVIPGDGVIVGGQSFAGALYNGALANGQSSYYLSKTAGIPYQVIGDVDSDSKAILCDFPGAVIEYTARITKVGLFPPAFANILAWAITAEIVTPLSQDLKYAQAANQSYQRALAEAGALAFGEGQDDVLPDGELLDSRDY